ACAIYDIKTDRFSIHDDCVPTIFGTSPIRPDGKGFLAMTWSGRGLGQDKGKLAWRDWEGKETTLKGDFVGFDRGARGAEGGGLAFITPCFYDSRWEKDRAILRVHDEYVEVDTKSFTALRKKVRPRKEGDDFVWNAFRFSDTKGEVRVLGDDQFGEAKNEPTVRLELVKPGAKPEVLDKGTKEAYLMIPSPDQSLVAVRAWRNDDIDRGVTV